MKVYLASGWFTPKAAEEVEALENLLGELGFTRLAKLSLHFGVRT